MITNLIRNLDHVPLIINFLLSQIVNKLSSKVFNCDRFLVLISFIKENSALQI